MALTSRCQSVPSWYSTGLLASRHSGNMRCTERSTDARRSSGDASAMAMAISPATRHIRPAACGPAVSPALCMPQ